MADRVHTGANRNRDCRGFTLVELLIVVVILGIVGAIAAPTFRSGEPERLEAAATQLAGAIRFARSEAIRTGVIHGIQVQHTNEQYTIGRVDLTTQPIGTAEVSRHPLTLQLYDVYLDQAPNVGVVIANTSDVFDYAGLGRRKRLAFNPDGTPVFIRPVAGETYHLTDGNIRLQLGEHIRAVVVQPYTGRVTIQ